MIDDFEAKMLMYAGVGKSGVDEMIQKEKGFQNRFH